jgi:hypothetical protein
MKEGETIEEVTMFLLDWVVYFDNEVVGEVSIGDL